MDRDEYKRYEKRYRDKLTFRTPANIG